MTYKLTAKNNIVHALIWAAIILASSYLIKDEKAASTLFFILIGGYVATSGLMTNSSINVRQEGACLMRYLRRVFGKTDASSGQ
jgi:hypothetical protein